MHPVLFVLPGGQPIFTYGVMLALALTTAAGLLTYLTRVEGLPVDGVLAAFLAACVAGVVGSRVLYIATNLEEFDTLASMLEMRRGGLTSYGAFFGAIAAAWLVLRARKINPLAVADLAAPCFAVMLLLGRVGCYGFGCDFGVPLSERAPGWLRRLGTFPHWPPGTLAMGDGAPAWVQHVRERGLPLSSPASLPVHPTQLYDMLVGALLLATFFALRPLLRFRGQIFLQLVLVYGACRFALETVRDDMGGSVPPALPEHVIVPFGLVALGLAAAVWVAPVIDDPTGRRVVQAVVFLPALAALALLSPRAALEGRAMQLSVTQLFALLTGIGAAYAFSRLRRAALADPEGAMALSPVVASPPRKKRWKKAKSAVTPDDER
jgi:phosphatidylglycerol:prolipoprotein diacylglycerol transferase